MMSRKLRLCRGFRGGVCNFLFACSIFAGIFEGDDQIRSRRISCQRADSTRALVGIKNFYGRPNRGRISSKSETEKRNGGEVTLELLLIAGRSRFDRVYCENSLYCPMKLPGAFRVNVRMREERNRFPF